jgi:hypothetical protein
MGRLSAVLVHIGLVAAGCSSQLPLGHWDGPAAAAGTTVAEWTYADEKGKVVQTEHYRIHTTIQDQEVLELLPQVMEGAWLMYREVAPNIQATERPLDCFVFRWRSEWEAYTQSHAGTDARIYRQIRSGGYTVQDRFVAYYIGHAGTFSVAAHEGWHQFAGRHFKGRLPPFFEEGMACMFETLTWKAGLPRWNLSVNGLRAQSLRKAMESKSLWPLEKLCAMHAGDIVGQSGERIDAFYAQSWAFARFLWEAEDGKYRPAMQTWLRETADGTVYDPTRSHARSYAPWNRRAVQPMIEHYLGMKMPQVEQAYEAYMKRVASEEAGGQTAG